MSRVAAEHQHRIDISPLSPQNLALTDAYLILQVQSNQYIQAFQAWREHATVLQEKVNSDAVEISQLNAKLRSITSASGGVMKNPTPVPSSSTLIATVPQQSEELRRALHDVSDMNKQVTVCGQELRNLKAASDKVQALVTNLKNTTISDNAELVNHKKAIVLLNQQLEQQHQQAVAKQTELAVRVATLTKASDDCDAIRQKLMAEAAIGKSVASASSATATATASETRMRLLETQVIQMQIEIDAKSKIITEQAKLDQKLQDCISASATQSETATAAAVAASKTKAADAIKLSKVNAQLRQLEAENKLVQADIVLKSNEITKLRSENLNMSTDKLNLQSTASAVQSQLINRKNDDIAKLQGEIKQLSQKLKTSVDTYEQSHLNLLTENAKLQGDANRAMAVTATINQKYDAYVTTSAADAARLWTDNKRLTDANVQITSENKRLEQLWDAVRKSNAELVKEALAYRASPTSTATAGKDAQIIDLQSKLTTLKAEYGKEIDDMRLELQTVNARLNESDNERERLSREATRTTAPAFTPVPAQVTATTNDTNKIRELQILLKNSRAETAACDTEREAMRIALVKADTDLKTQLGVSTSLRNQRDANAAAIRENNDQCAADLNTKVAAKVAEATRIANDGARVKRNNDYMNIRHFIENFVAIVNRYATPGVKTEIKTDTEYLIHDPDPTMSNGDKLSVAIIPDHGDWFKRRS